ncbi:TraG family conjugative transposon ATPase [Algoriphagus resistens]|uniref:TraG family conjugative transposon ATPase n=1 Tax=Algoriphagus resistens TaxID=1750590 RepID=UPI00071681C2|nr:TraG family conjugative transposon ATPase [Algoriphagus resistens]
MKSVELNKLFPLYKYTQELLVSRQGDLTACYALDLPALFTLSKSEAEAIHGLFVKAWKVLPEGTIIWKQDWFEKETVQVDWTSDSSFLSRKSDAYFEGKPVLTHHCYIFITFPNPEKPLRNSSFSNLFRSHWIGEPILTADLLQRIKGTLGQMEHLLGTGNISLKRLEENELLGGEHSKGLLEKYLMPGAFDRELIDQELKPEWRSGKQYLGMVSISSLDQIPSELEVSRVYEPYSGDLSKFYLGFASPMGQLLSCNHIYQQVIQLVEKEESFSRLESKRLRMHALSRYSRANELAADSIQEYLEDGIKEAKVPVRMHAHLLCWEDSNQALTTSLQQAASALSNLELIPKIETIGAPQLYWAGIPGNAAALPLNETCSLFLDAALCLYNLESSPKADLAAKGLKLGDRTYGQPVWVDLSDEPVRKGWITNRNKFILGPSGSGKSFFTNHMVRSYYEQGTHVVLVDVGHSYQGLCELVGGYYFTYSESNPICFNPFYLGAEGLGTEKKESLKTLLLALWKKEDESFRRSEYVAISNAVKCYYEKLAANNGIEPCFNTFYEFLADDYSKLIREEGVKSGDFDLGNFLYVLKPFYSGGEFDYLLNARENLDLLEQPFIVFELDKIKDHPILFPVVTLIIMEIFIAKMRTLKGIRKMILIEEAWKAIAKEGMAEYIKYLFKTVRKFYGEAIVVTQEVEDIIQSPIVKEAIINNSDCKILLDQRKYQNKFDQIQRLLALSEKDKALVLSLNRANDPALKYKEVFIGLGSQSQVFRTEVSMEEYLTYTTEEKEKMELEKLCFKHGGDREHAIVELSSKLQEVE